MKHVAGICFLVALVMGTGSTISSKVMFGMESIGRDGELKKFEKPLMQTFLMFVAMLIAFPIHLIHTKSSFAKVSKQTGIKNCIRLCFPAMADLGATALSTAALMYVTVSVFQLVRCTIIVFVAVLKVLFVGFKPDPYMKFGISLNALAILMVSASCFGEENDSSDAIIGVGVLLLGCLVTSAQYVLEENAMAKTNTPPMLVIGMEGFWGTLLMLAFIFPIASIIPGKDNGCVEDFYDSLIMIKNSSTLQGIALFYIVCITCFNICSIYVTYLLDAVWRSILANFRPVAVWSADLALYYIVTAHAFGEAWTDWSWLQLSGMILLFVGTGIYNGNIRFGCFDYSKLDYIKEPEPDLDAHTVVIKSSSPLLSTGYRKPSTGYGSTHPYMNINNNEKPVTTL